MIMQNDMRRFNRMIEDSLLLLSKSPEYIGVNVTKEIPLNDCYEIVTTIVEGQETHLCIIRGQKLQDRL